MYRRQLLNAQVCTLSNLHFKWFFPLIGWFWGALFPRTADPVFTNPYVFTFPLQGYVPRPFILISLSPPLGGIRSRSSQQQSVFGSANATDSATGAGRFFPLFLSYPGDATLSSKNFLLSQLGRLLELSGGRNPAHLAKIPYSQVLQKK